MTDKKTRDEEVAQARRYMAMPLTKAAMDRARGHWVPWLIEALDEAEAERDALKAKLAALVKASQPFANDQGCDGVHHGYTDRHDQRETCPVVARLRDALAAAKVQP